MMPELSGRVELILTRCVSEGLPFENEVTFILHSRFGL